MIDKAMMHCARDIENMYHKGIPYSKALRHMQYLLAPYEVRKAKKELQKLKDSKRLMYKGYKDHKGV